METRTLTDKNGNVFDVEFFFDDEAKVWIATSDDIKGLVLESESLDNLIQRVLKATPELIELNNLPKRENLKLSMNRIERVAFA